MHRALFALALLSACSPELEEPPLDTSAVGRSCEDSTCVQPGDNLFESNEGARRILAFLPDDTAGAPILFAWHYLGGSPEELVDWMPVDAAVEDGFIVVVPESRALLGSEWDVTSSPRDNEDIALFDALLDSLIEVQAADRDRVYSTGFSAGGLFTSYLTMHRAPRLAATAPFSGGAPLGTYSSPGSDLPVMVSWGGTADTYGGFDFNDANERFIDQLVEDGNPVLACDHGLGHWLPEDAASRTRSFFLEHSQTGRVADFQGCELQ